MIHKTVGRKITVWILMFDFLRRDVTLTLANKNLKKCNNVTKSWNVTHDPTCTLVMYTAELDWCDLMTCDSSPINITLNGQSGMLYAIWAIARIRDYKTPSATIPVVQFRAQPLFLFVPYVPQITSNYNIRGISNGATTTYTAGRVSFSCKTRLLTLTASVASAYPYSLSPAAVNSPYGFITPKIVSSTGCNVVGSTCVQTVSTDIPIPDDSNSVFMMTPSVDTLKCSDISRCATDALVNLAYSVSGKVGVFDPFNGCDPRISECGVFLANSLAVSIVMNDTVPGTVDPAGSEFFPIILVTSSTVRMSVTGISVKSVRLCALPSAADYTMDDITDCNGISYPTVLTSNTFFSIANSTLQFGVIGRNIPTGNYSMSVVFDVTVDESRLTVEEIAMLQTEFTAVAAVQLGSELAQPVPPGPLIPKDWFDTWWIILIIVVAALLIIILFISIIACCCCKKGGGDSTSTTVPH